MLSASSLLGSTAPLFPHNRGFVECTFSPRGRNRFACTRCSNGKGGPLVLKRSQLDGHKQGTFVRAFPPSPDPPAWIPPKVDQRSKGPRTRVIDVFADSWLCPECYERNEFSYRYGSSGPARPSRCWDCGRTYTIERDYIGL